MVAYEADDLDPLHRLGWSVVVTGVAAIDDPERAARYERQLRPWVDMVMDVAIGIRPEIVSGFRFVPAANVLDGRQPRRVKSCWRLRPYCGHVAEKQAHYGHKTLHAGFTGSVRCSECGLDPATIVDGAAIGLAAEPPPTPRTASAPRKPTRAELEARVRELEAEVQPLRPTDAAG